MVYYDDMCESKLGKMMCFFRCERPDEWQMDEFIRMAEQMHKEIELLRQAEKDAARYRWLRDKYSESNVSELVLRDNWEIAIDEAMQCNK